MKTPHWLETDRSQELVIALFVLGVVLILVSLWT